MSILTALQAVSAKLGVTTRANNEIDQLNAINDIIGADRGINAEECILNYAKSMAQQNPLSEGVTVTALDDTIDLWGHVASDLQEDIVIEGNKITGKLKQVTEGALPARWGPGYFLALGFSDFPVGTNACLAGVKPSLGSGYGDVYADTDHAAVAQINDRKIQKYKVITTTASGQALTQTFDISGLEFIPADNE